MAFGRLDFGTLGSSGGSVALSAAETFIARTSGLDATHTTAYTDFIDGLETDSLWTKIDALYVLATNSEGNAALNLKGTSYSLTKHGSPTFTADQGYTFNGSNTWLDTSFVLTAGVAYTLNSSHYGIYTRTRSAALGAFIAVLSGANSANMLEISATNAIGRMNDATNLTDGGATSTGTLVMTRSAAGAREIYYRGISKNSDATASVGVPVTYSVYIGARNADGTADQFNSSEIAMASIGGGLSDTEASNLSSRMNTYMTALGTNVY